MATPTIFTPFAVTPARLSNADADLYTGGANGGVFDYIVLINTDTSPHLVTIYLTTGGAGAAANVLASGIQIPADGVPVNVLELINARPLHYGGSWHLRGYADAANVVTYQAGGTDYA